MGIRSGMRVLAAALTLAVLPGLGAAPGGTGGPVAAGAPQRPVAPPGSGTAEPPDAPAAPDPTGERAAAARARATGEPVEVAALTTPTTRVLANPDGTFTVQEHPVPVRARTGSSWSPIDTTLRFGADHTVAPAASGVPMVFSGGGDAPLVRLGEGTSQLALRWPRPLPRPELSGDTATYREVLPGVDLRMRALRHGYAQVFVVKTRQAAANPAVRRLSLGLETTGVSVRQRPDGSLVAVDRSGAELFQAPPPRMWDSGGTGPRHPADGSAAGGVGAAAGVVGAAADGPAGSRREAAVGVELAADRLTLVPDQKLLTDPNTTFPVEIDPDWSAGRSAWALIYNLPTSYANQSYWFGDSDKVAKVGYSNWDSPTVRARSYFQFNISRLQGKHILDAEFNIYQNWTPSCNARVVQLYETGPINSGTTWNNRPWAGAKLGEQNVAAGRVGCPGRWLGFDVRSAVANSVSAGRGTVTFTLRAADENDPYAWRKFNPDNVSLSVRYNSYPTTPTGLTTEGRACAVEPNQPYVFTTGPALRATASDPDGGTVSVTFEWWLRNGDRLGTTTTLRQSSGSQFRVSIPSDDYQDGDTIAWRARTYDGVDYSPWSAWCHVTVDQTAPDRPPVVSSTSYPERDLGGGIGQTGEFTFGANGVADVVGYYFDLHDQPQRYVAANGLGGTATGLATPASDGPSSLYVRSVDRAGNLGPLYRYDFFVGRGSPPVAYWRLDGYDQATAAPDSSGNGFDGTVTGIGSTAAWTPGRHGDAIRLAGGHVATTGGPAVRTDRTFSVAAWVRTDSLPSGWTTAVSQDGGRMSGFYLQLNPQTHQWSFMMPATDEDHAPRRRANSTASAVPGRWTHLVGTFDHATGTLRLYVDGVAQPETGTHTTPWQAGGSVQVGRARYQAGPVDYFQGAIDDVRLYDRLLSAEEIRDLAGGPTRSEGFWPLDAATGTVVDDASGNLRIGTLRGGASWTTTSAVGDGAVWLDGGTGFVETDAQAVRTDASFTVSAYARLDATDDQWQTVVSQDGAKSSGFALMYRGDTKRWTFALSPGDADNPAYLTADANDVAYPGEWAQLTGVYDATARQLRLYVDGALAGAAAIPADTSLAHVPGALVIGRGKQAGAPNSWLRGAVDHVRVYTGVLTADQIRADFREPEVERESIYAGQFSRWVDHNGGRLVSVGRIPAGHHFERPLGFPAPDDAPNTRMLYSCLAGTDEFTSMEPDCEGQRMVGELARVYITPPEGVDTFALYRCRLLGSGEHSVSVSPDCEGHEVEGLLGYTRAYALLIRYREVDGAGERRSGAHRVPATYQPEAVLGLLADDGPGMVPLLICRSGADVFSSTDATCEGGEVVERAGAIWSAPPAGLASAPLLRCRVTGGGERFDSLDPGCEGQQVESTLGYVLTRLPAGEGE